MPPLLQDLPLSQRRALPPVRFSPGSKGRTTGSSPSFIWAVSVMTKSEAEDAVSELFLNLFGQPAASYTNAETGATTVTVHLKKQPRDVAATRTAIRDGLQRIESCGLNFGTGGISIRRILRKDWADSWKHHFKPIEIGHELLVKPSWSKRRPRRGQAVVVLDPGLSFGTGQHPTTEFCLRQLVARRSPGERQSFLDIGTGSGILAMAAAKLGYAPVHAFDLDPQAVRTARANARANHVGTKVRPRCADLVKLRRRGKRYDVVCANLETDLLITERDRITARLNPGGCVVVAGILAREFGKLRRAYEQARLQMVASKTKRQWQSAAFYRRANFHDGILRKR